MKKTLSILFLISLFGCRHSKQPTKSLPIDDQATSETVMLYNRLIQLLDTGIMLGHQDDLAYGHSWYKEPGRSDVRDVVGDYPAVIGWELGHLEIGAEHNLDSVYFSDMQRYIEETYERGGITTISWHGNNIATGKSAWDCEEDTVVRSLLEDGVHHQAYLEWLDRLGDFFHNLQDDKGQQIPVVFRMYHEHTGGWFWWGNKQCTPEEYKKMWIMTVDYLRNKKKVHNLLYAYSTATVKSEEEFFERYPGDGYVDLIGYDCYLTSTDTSAVANYKKDMDLNLRIITNYAKNHNKIPFIGETGLQSIEDATYYTDIVYPIIKDYKIAWVLFWRNAWEADKPNHYYVPYQGHEAVKDFAAFTAKPTILLNNDINMK